MTKFFNKAVAFTDIHLGLKNNSITHLQDCEDFIDWTLKTALEHGCDTGFFLGDWNHHRSSINLQTLNFSLRLLEKINDAFEHFYFIPGNHDLFYRDKRDIHSSEWAKHLPNITIINDWFVKNDVAIVPWLVGDDYKKLSSINAKYMFGHFELPGFLMNSMVRMPDHGTINRQQLKGVEQVFSGHFHMRQTYRNIHYIGNCFPHNYADHDSNRGIMILEWDQEPLFLCWPDQPTYAIVRFSELLENIESILKPKLHLRIELDKEISYEESLQIKEAFLNDYGLREISMVPLDFNEDQVKNIEVSFNSVDTIINEQILSIESSVYDTKLLMDIYKNL